MVYEPSDILDYGVGQEAAQHSIGAAPSRDIAPSPVHISNPIPDYRTKIE